MKVGIVGCGPSGLNAVKQCIAEGFDVIAFDKNPEIGGEWYSTLQVGSDKYGVDIHSKIYEGLTTNLPKDLMAFSDYPHKENSKSFGLSEKILKYLQSYANNFNLRKHIKLEHHVIRVSPNGQNKWEMIVRDLPRNEFVTHIFDAIFICIGLSAPWTPQIEGQNNFKGQVVHSRDYRNARMYENEKVLLIGSGLSAIEMIFEMGKVAEKVVWVNKFIEKYGKTLNFNLPKCVTEKSQIKRITCDGAEFIDGSTEDFSIIAYATGYDFTFPFLSVDSNISINDKLVYPLYKQCINANRSSLAIIGLPFLALTFPMFELQIKFCLQFWTERKKLPSREDMLSDIDEDLKERNVENGKNNHQAHYLGLEMHESYYNDLANIAGIDSIKPVFVKMFNHNFAHVLENFQTFRSFDYKTLNETEFACNCSVELS